MQEVSDTVSKEPVSNLNPETGDRPFDPNQVSEGQEEKMTEWKSEPTINGIKEDLDYARQATNDAKCNVEGWVNLRNATGAESGNKSKPGSGRSSVQPKVIRKHNEWRYPALSEPFLNSDRMFEVRGRTHEDIKAAEQNELVLNWQFDTKIKKVAFIDSYVRTCVDEGTIIVRVGWDRKTEKVTEEVPVYDYYDVESEEEMQILVEATKAYKDDPELFEQDPSIPDTLKASVAYGIEKQQPVSAVQTGTEKITFSKIVINRPSLKMIDVANFFVDPSCDGDLDEAQYVIHTYESTKSDLKKRGIYKNLDKVNWGSNAVKANSGDPDHESNTPISDTRTTTQKSKTLVYEYWGLHDIHGDEEMVPVVVTFIGDTIIQMTENPFPDRKPPFVVVPYMPILKAIHGEADASILQDNQRVIGAVSRGMIDLMGRSANAQTGYAKNFLDPANRKRFVNGEDFEFNPNVDPKLAISQLTYPEIPSSALQIIGMQNEEAEGLSGVKSFTAGISGDSFGKVARGISGALDAAGRREMSILRRLGEGMKLIGKKIISMNLFFLTKEEVIRVTNDEYVKINRDDLAGDFDLIVDISTAEVDEAQSNDLGYMLQTMGPDMDPGLSQIILAKIANLKRMPDLAKRIEMYKPEPDPMQLKIQELEIAKLESEIALNNSRAEHAAANADNINLDTELDMSGEKHARNIESQGAQSIGNRNLQVTKAITEGKTGAGNIEAAVGFNKMVEATDRPAPKPFEPRIEAEPEFQPLNNNAQPLAIPQ